MSDKERIRQLEQALLDLLQRIQHLEAEAADRRFAETVKMMRRAA